MSCNDYTKVWELAPRELISMQEGRGTTLRVTRGTLWVTFEHDTRDVVLKSGDVFTIDRSGLTLLAAHGATTVCVLAKHAEAVQLRAGRPSLATRVGRWLKAVAEASLARRPWAPHI